MEMEDRRKVITSTVERAYIDSADHGMPEFGEETRIWVLDTAMDQLADKGIEASREEVSEVIAQYF
jgi:hypothetical protein